MPSDTIENETTENEASHVIIDGVKYRYVKKATRSLGHQPRMDHKDDKGKIIPTVPVPWMHVCGVITQAEMEQGEESDYIRFLGLFQIEARNADDSKETVVSRNLIVRDIEEHLFPFFQKMKRIQKKNASTSKNTEYLGLPDFHEVRIDLELLCKAPASPNRRGFDIEVRQVTPTVCVFSLHTKPSADGTVPVPTEAPAENSEVDKPHRRGA